MRDRRPLLALAAALLLGVALLALFLAGRSTAPEPAELPPVAPVAVFPSLPPEVAPAPDAPPPEKRWRDVTCLLPVVTPGSTDPDGVPLLVDDPWGPEPIPIAGSLRPSALVFSAPYDDGAALVTLPGHERAGLIWFTDAAGEVECLFPQDPVALPTGTVRLAALPARSESELYLHAGCGTHQEATGEPVEFEAPVGTCEVAACRVTGRYHRCGERLEVVVRADRVTHASPLPPAPVGGLGLDVRERTGFWMIGTVEPGSPAEDAGLVAGDHLLALDGVPITELGSQEVGQILVGDAGETVELEVEHEDGSIDTYALVRTAGDAF